MPRIFTAILALVALGDIVWATPSLAQSGAVLCYTLADNATAQQNVSYTPADSFVAAQGGAVSVTHTGLGAYSVYCGGIGPGGVFNTKMLGTVQVTAVGNDNVYCHVNDWSSGVYLEPRYGRVSGFQANVLCFGKGGGTGGGPAAADSEFTLMFAY